MNTRAADSEAPKSQRVDGFETSASLASPKREQLSDHLQATLSDLIEVALFGKHLQWNVASSDFRFLQMLDEFVQTWRNLADTVAQRASATGTWPDGQATTVASHTQHDVLGAGVLSDDEIVYHLTDRLMALVGRMHERLHLLAELDPVSHDMLGEVICKLQMQLWTVRVQTD
jgi:starvation-inducible DNA-binding protein